MADTKITALTALTAADPANDVIPIVDVSDTSMAASGTTKKISVNNILGASGTATLASATITGDLTVDTSTLKVDSTNNRVGIGTASPTAALDINGNVIIRDTFNLTMGFGNQQRILAGGGSDNTYQTFSQWTGAAYTERLRINATGNLVLTGGTAAANGVGVTFPATQVASSDANCLDDYEEGTWTGTIGGATTNPTTPVTSTGRYTKIGRQVSIEIGFYGDTTGASGRITVSGLPFTSNSSLSRPGVIAMDTMGTFTGSPIAYLAAGVTLVELFASNSNGSLSNVTHNAGAGRALYMQLTYTV
jgi:hypothetical protein